MENNDIVLQENYNTQQLVTTTSQDEKNLVDSKLESMIKQNIMKKTARYRVSRLATFCTDPTEAECNIREAIGWGLELTKRSVRMSKLEKLLMRFSVGTGNVEKVAKKLAMETHGGRKGPVEERDRYKMITKKGFFLMKNKVKDAREDLASSSSSPRRICGGWCSGGAGWGWGEGGEEGGGVLELAGENGSDAEISGLPH